MIKGLIFDLDGTLVQTEILKARSYARAAVKLSPDTVTEEKVLEEFKKVVGLSRQEVAQTLLARLGLEDAARQQMERWQTCTPWQAFVQIRMSIYDEMLADPDILHQHLCPYNVGLLTWAKENGYRTGLATMSHCVQASKVLQILQLRSSLEFVATRDDVEHGKPDPEIYRLVARGLALPPEQCLVIEDSSTGVKAALAAGMGCIAVTTDFTRQAVHRSQLLDERWIVDDPVNLQPVARRFIDERNQQK